MTAKQKAARAKFKQVVAEAKKLRKKNPKLTQAQAVKQAWAIEYKKAPKKVAEVGKVKKSAPKKKAAKKVVKKAAPKKKAAKKSVAKKSATKSSYHKDTKSHNVNIRVISGINNDLMKELKSINNREIYFNDLLQKQLFEEAALKSQSKGKNSGIAKAQLMATKRYISDIKGILKHLKSQKLSLKRRIK